MLIAHVIGHTGCQKCTLLNRRLDAILQEEPYKSTFRKIYHDTEDPRHECYRIDALVFFCRCGCINPNRIPAMILSNTYGTLLERPRPECTPLQGARLYQYFGLQTDYTNGGVITTAMIRETLDEALAYLDSRIH